MSLPQGVPLGLAQVVVVEQVTRDLRSRIWAGLPGSLATTFHAR
jgi:hypothetical protein